MDITTHHGFDQVVDFIEMEFSRQDGSRQRRILALFGQAPRGATSPRIGSRIRPLRPLRIFSITATRTVHQDRFCLEGLFTRQIRARSIRWSAPIPPRSASRSARMRCAPLQRPRRSITRPTSPRCRSGTIALSVLVLDPDADPEAGAARARGTEAASIGAAAVRARQESTARSERLMGWMI